MLGKAITPSQTRHRVELGAAVLLVTAITVLPLAGSPPAVNPNEVVRLQLTAAIAFYAKFDISDTIPTYGVSEDVSIRSGRVFSDKAPGLSMAGVPAVWVAGPLLGSTPPNGLPAYWPMRHLLTLLLVSLPTVALFVLIAAVSSRGELRHRSAFVLLAALTTPLLTYGTVFFGHSPAAFLITCSWLMLLGPPGTAARASTGSALLGGLAAGLAITTEYPTVLLVAVIHLTLLCRRSSASVLVAAFAGTGLGLVPALWYHWAAFGAPWVTGYSFKATPEFEAIIDSGFHGIGWPTPEALWGVLGSFRRGLFAFSPFLLLAFVGAWTVARRRGIQAVSPFVMAFAAYVGFAAGFVDWTAGWCAAARHLIPIVGLLAILALRAVDHLSEHRSGIVIVTVLVVSSTLNTVLTLVLTPFFPPEFDHPLAQLVVPSLAEGFASPNIVSSTTDAAALWVWAIATAVALVSVTWALLITAPKKARWVLATAVLTTALHVTLLIAQAFPTQPENERFRAMTLEVLGQVNSKGP